MITEYCSDTYFWCVTVLSAVASVALGVFVVCRKRWISANNLGLQMIGLGLKNWHMVCVWLLTLSLWLPRTIMQYQSELALFGGEGMRWHLYFWFMVLLCTVFLVVKICMSFRAAIIHDTRRKRDAINFRIQTVMVIAVGMGVILTMLLFDINNENFAPFGLCAALLGWVFQDIIKGVFSYYNLYLNNLLHIGDWITIPGKGVDGEIEEVSLVSVRIANWDNTFSSIPMSDLQTEHLINWQQVAEGRTSGRCMHISFLIDPGTIQPLTQEELTNLRETVAAVDNTQSILPDDIALPVLNLQLFRQYLLRWLLVQDKVSPSPRLMVRLQEPTDNGIPLQIYAYLTETIVETFEVEQSRIMEHILLSMPWFGLQLHQPPTAYAILSEKGGRR